MKLLIVDDDYQIREGIRYAVDWERMGISGVETAANGLEALEMIDKDMPDLILADIQMPGMTGLEMIREIRKRVTDTRVVFISAYSDFGYCREALQLGANDYILKPIEMKILEQTMERQVSELLSERGKLLRQREVLIRQECRQIYENGEKKDGLVLRRIMSGRVPFLEQDYLVTAVIMPGKWINPDSSAYQNMDSRKRKEILAEIHDCVTQAAGEENDILVLPPCTDFLVILSKGSNSALETVYYHNRLKKILERTVKKLGESDSLCIAGISASHRIEDLQKGYIESREALECFYYIPERRVFLFSEACFTDHISDETKKCINTMIRLSSEKKEKVQLKKQAIVLKESLLKKPVKNRILRRELTRIIWENDRIDLQNYERFIKESGDADDLDHYIVEVERYFSFHMETGCNTGKDLHVSHGISLALSYIEEYYTEPIGIAEAARIAGMSPNHFSSQFKKEVGTSMTEYVTGLRMEKARALALYSSMKVNEICEAVGFSGYMYFSRIFRQTFGCSVSEMRSNSSFVSTQQNE